MAMDLILIGIFIMYACLKLHHCFLTASIQSEAVESIADRRQNIVVIGKKRSYEKIDHLQRRQDLIQRIKKWKLSRTAKKSL